ncbi:hypothetical protein ACLOJK_031585 [Asimina triloba]
MRERRPLSPLPIKPIDWRFSPRPTCHASPIAKPRPLSNPRSSSAPFFSVYHLHRQTLPSLDLVVSVRFVSQNYMGDKQRRGAGMPDLFSGQTEIRHYSRLDLVAVVGSVSQH